MERVENRILSIRGHRVKVDETIRRLSSKIGEEKTGFLLTLWKRFQSHCTILN
jgi:predicted ThiF/HesA family dinucleotide-utilizing enzyme